MKTQISTTSRDCVASRMTHNKYFTSQMRLTSSSYLPQPPCFRLIRIILRVKTGWLMLVLLNSNIEPRSICRYAVVNVRQAKTNKYSNTSVCNLLPVHYTANILRSSLAACLNKVVCWKLLLSRHNFVEIKLTCSFATRWLFITESL